MTEGSGDDVTLQPPVVFDTLASFAAARPSRAERIEAGRAIRARVPRSSHAEYRPARRRTDPIKTLEAQNVTRISWLVPIRMARMAASPFAFLRGAAAVMAADLAESPCTGLDVMACGDMHLANFGVFGSAERNLVFAINDFDEVHPGPWEWDVKRLAASAAVAALHVGGDRDDAAAAARAVTAAYIFRMRRYSEMGFLDVWYDLIDEASILAVCPPSLRAKARSVMGKARGRGHVRTLDRLTEKVDGLHRFVEDVPIIVRETHLADGEPIAPALDLMLDRYLASLPPDRSVLLRRYRIVDVARKVVGVGSVGTSCWVLLLDGLDASDPLFLQIKEARTSVLAPYAKVATPFANEGQRVVVGQRLIQGSPDIFLGWGSNIGALGRDYFIRQLADMKGGIGFEGGDADALASLPAYCRLCGWALALAHAKSGDAAMISGYCGTGDALPDAIAGFALAYLDQTEADHGLLLSAIRSGRITAADAELAGGG